MTMPTDTVDVIAQLKQSQKEGWKNFVPLEAITTPAAAHLVEFAGIMTGQRVLDVGCGTGAFTIGSAKRGLLTFSG